MILHANEFRFDDIRSVVFEVCLSKQIRFRAVANWIFQRDSWWILNCNSKLRSSTLHVARWCFPAVMLTKWFQWKSSKRPNETRATNAARSIIDQAYRMGEWGLRNAYWICGQPTKCKFHLFCCLISKSAGQRIIGNELLNKSPD